MISEFFKKVTSAVVNQANSILNSASKFLSDHVGSLAISSLILGTVALISPTALQRIGIKSAVNGVLQKAGEYFMMGAAAFSVGSIVKFNFSRRLNALKKETALAVADYNLAVKENEKAAKLLDTQQKINKLLKEAVSENAENRAKMVTVLENKLDKTKGFLLWQIERLNHRLNTANEYLSVTEALVKASPNSDPINNDALSGSSAQITSVVPRRR